MNTQNHILSEIKGDLDWASGEVGKTEADIMKLEVDFNASLKDADEEDAKRLIAEKNHLKDRIGLNDAYALQKRAAKRFYLLSHIFEVASSQKSKSEISEELHKILFRAGPDEEASKAYESEIAKLSEGLVAYFSDGHSDQSDKIIRDAWDDIEDILKKLGRSQG